MWKSCSGVYTNKFTPAHDTSKSRRFHDYNFPSLPCNGCWAQHHMLSELRRKHPLSFRNDRSWVMCWSPLCHRAPKNASGSESSWTNGEELLLCIAIIFVYDPVLLPALPEGLVCLASRSAPNSWDCLPDPGGEIVLVVDRGIDAVSTEDADMCCDIGNVDELCDMGKECDPPTVSARKRSDEASTAVCSLSASPA